MLLQILIMNLIKHFLKYDEIPHSLFSPISIFVYGHKNHNKYVIFHVDIIEKFHTLNVRIGI